MWKTAWVVAIAAVTIAPAVGQRSSAASPPLPPLSYVCPMPGDEDVIEDQPGRCPKCGMALTPIRLDTTWTCPLHAAIHADAAGTCPIDGRDLIQMTMSVSWSCRGTGRHGLEPGACPDGSPMTKQYLPRPHGNHNPQHGGQFFMAPDNWHHLEGTYPRPGIFRMYLYDDYTRPLSRDRVRATTGHVVVQGQAFRLAPVQNGRYLEASLGSVRTPAQMQAMVTFTEGGRQHVFDFSFPTYTRDPVATSTGTALAAAGRGVHTSAPTVASSSSPPSLAATRGTPPGVGSSGARPMSPAVLELVSQLRQRVDLIRSLIDNGRFGELYVPAFEAKDLALALDTHETELPADQRKTSEPAIATLVRSAYLLDAFGDIGNKEQIGGAYAQFAAAADAIIAPFQQHESR